MPTIVMTGGTSGFGSMAGRRMQDDPGTRLILGTRKHEDYPDRIELDLTSLASVRHFANEVRARFPDQSIDGLILNAGIIRRDTKVHTADGFEITFTVNVLSQYLLLRLLVPHLSPNGRIVLTTSGAHDPAVTAGLVVPRHANAELLTYPNRDPQSENTPSQAAEHAYTASKLYIALIAQYIERQEELRDRGIEVIAFDPGQVFGTGLARDLPLHKRSAWRALGHPVLGWPIRQVQNTLNTPNAAGNALAQLALNSAIRSDGKFYVALRRGQLVWCNPSILAQNRSLADDLWKDCAALADLPASQPISLVA
jgi:NAD(P)-dependent dehydrogenase (short-subunit alcohol dehydrogenase family)